MKGVIIMDDNIKPNEYMDDNGNLRCRKCHCITYEDYQKALSGEKLLIPFRMMCECDKQTELERQEHEAIKKANNRRQNCFEGVSAMYGCTFASDKYSQDEAGRVARKYVNEYNTIRQRKQNGLMFYGPVGTGKSFYAAAIANALIGNGLYVRFSSIQRVVSAIDISDRSAYINDLVACDLLILDDFGRENNSPYTQQIAFEIIDGRTASQKPLIITTNLSLKRIANPANDDEARLFTRILSACYPVETNSTSKRLETARQLYDESKQFYNS